MQRLSAWLASVSLGAGLPFLGSVGCAHRDPADRSVEQLRAEITRLQADRDRLDQRVGALETAEQQRDVGDARKLGPAPASSDGRGRSEPPRQLPVVRVGEEERGSPSESESVDIGADGEARPIVQATGSPAGAKRNRSGSRRDGAPLTFSPDAKQGYESALTLVRAKQYDKALESLTAFLVRFPDHPYAENATYWRGECFYAKGEYARAAEQFEGLLARFPYGNKAPDALLKLGLCQQRTGSQEQAQKTFAELKDRYPKSDAVRQIPRP